jgi:DNA-binding LacI/PurR family transcriptional regulator
MSEFTRRIDRHLDRKAFREKKSRQDQLLSATPSMASLIDKGVTALICPNDSLAYQYWMWLGRAGYSVPRHVSLISFDNSLQGRIYPVSTVDFGFAHLGYQAAHIMIGDISVHSDKDGNIAGVCTVVDRGSVRNC